MAEKGTGPLASSATTLCYTLPCKGLPTLLPHVVILRPAQQAPPQPSLPRSCVIFCPAGPPYSPLPRSCIVPCPARASPPFSATFLCYALPSCLPLLLKSRPVSLPSSPSSPCPGLCTGLWPTIPSTCSTTTLSFPCSLTTLSSTCSTSSRTQPAHPPFRLPSPAAENAARHGTNAGWTVVWNRTPVGGGFQDNARAQCRKGGTQRGRTGGEAYTIDTPQNTMKTANMTLVVKTRRSQNFSTRQTKGMIMSLAICKATAPHQNHVLANLNPHQRSPGVEVTYSRPVL